MSRSLARAGFHVLFALALLTPFPASAQNKWALRERAYYEPLIADPRAANVNIMFFGLSDEFPFSQEPGRRRVWDISLGKEVPLVGYHSGGDPATELPKGKWGIGLWMPVSFHMVEDFKDASNPILNTDYRFSGMVKVQLGLTENARLGGRFQFGHESTHLGDEFSLAARRTRPDFRRINVSYEYWEYGISYETDRGKSENKHHLIFRHGGIGLFKPDKGYYSEKLLEPDGAVIARSERNFEPFFGFQWHHKKDLVGGWGPFVSIDARHKTIYDYSKPLDRVVHEDKQMSFNVLFGLRRANQRFLQKAVPDFYIRFYHGVNPAGQFRSQRNYDLFGVGIYVPL